MPVATIVWACAGVFLSSSLAPSVPCWLPLLITLSSLSPFATLVATDAYYSCLAFSSSVCYSLHFLSVLSVSQVQSSFLAPSAMFWLPVALILSCFACLSLGFLVDLQDKMVRGPLLPRLLHVLGCAGLHDLHPWSFPQVTPLYQSGKGGGQNCFFFFSFFKYFSFVTHFLVGKDWKTSERLRLNTLRLWEKVRGKQALLLSRCRNSGYVLHRK